MSDNTCPRCSEEYDRKVSLSSRHSKSIGLSDAERMCQVAERRRGGGMAMKSTRSDTEKYKFIGYIHE